MSNFYETCLIDGHKHLVSNMIKVVGGYVHKGYNSPKYLTRCRECNSLMVKPKDNIPRCPECEERIYKNTINSYGTKPRAVFKTNNKDSNIEMGCRYYGLELEYNNTDRCKVYNLGEELYTSKYIYNKSDGSISSGVEVVTSPCDKKSLKYLLEKMEDKMFPYIRERQYTMNAGVHIHVNKKSIDVIDRYKLCILLNTGQTQKEKYMIFYLSGRTKSSKDFSSQFRYCDIGATDRLFSNLEGHSYALNTANRHTYEFRIFRASADKEMILSYVEMVDTMIEFCHTHGVKDIRISTYIKWLKTHTDNKILLRKIQTFEKSNGVFDDSMCIATNEEVLKRLKGIHWSDYSQLIPYIEKLSSNKKILSEIENFKSHGNKRYSKDSEKDSGIVTAVKETSRKCMISLILKEVDKRKGKVKCA